MGWPYSIFELSSIPLGIMNLFKSHPTWATDYPVAYQRIRVVFAITFLWVRLVWCLYRIPLFLLDLTTVTAYYVPAGSWVQAYLATNVAATVLLVSLQLVWGQKVGGALWRFVWGRRSTKGSEGSSGIE